MAGIAQQREETPMECSGCDGKKVIKVRVQRIINNQRVCVERDERCPICEGTGTTTQAQVDAFMADLNSYTGETP